MTMIEMQGILGKMLTRIDNEGLSERERQKVFESAEYMAKIAKQMVNNADIVLRADKLADRHDRTDVMVGEICRTDTQQTK